MTDTCPCALRVSFDAYDDCDPAQVRLVRMLIMEHGEYTTVTIMGGKKYRVSRHCIALHGIKAAQIADYGFEEVP